MEIEQLYQSGMYNDINLIYINRMPYAAIYIHTYKHIYIDMWVYVLMWLYYVILIFTPVDVGLCL